MKYVVEYEMLLADFSEFYKLYRFPDLLLQRTHAEKAGKNP